MGGGGVYPQAWESWAAQVLSGIGAPINDANLQSLWLWSGFESGPDRLRWNNPLNTTLACCGWVRNMNSVGVKLYPSPQQGAVATVQTLLNGRYPQLLRLLRLSIPAGRTSWALAAGDLQTWGTGVNWLPADGPSPPGGTDVLEADERAWLKNLSDEVTKGQGLQSLIAESTQKLTDALNALKTGAGAVPPSGAPPTFTLTGEIVPK